MKRLWIILLFLSAAVSLWSQAALDHKVVYNDTRRNATTNLRIDQGRIFLNNKAMPQAELPASLQRIDPNIYYETTVAGVSEFSFNLGDRVYLVQEGKVTELADEGDGNGDYADSRTATEAYYSQLKRESPHLFYGLSREGALLEQVRELLFDYSEAQGKQREKIKEEIRLLLGQLYDINERNKELEIAELEDMIEAAKAEVQYRKAHKSEIIDNSLKNLLR